MKRKPLAAPAPEVIDWPRADPAALAAFDPNSKRCTMNCGKSGLDPRSYAEIRLLCDDCDCAPSPPSVHEQLRAALAREAALRAELAELKSRYA